ncbi:TrbC/VirB2 family protein [Brevundimonas nasdae]|uniref:TrbC/VirB2 family protein n=1 Tax=Brevundimonas nasdae TaxID=172043 RepID=UPI003F68F4F0
MISLYDPPGSSVLVAAVGWIQSLVLGSLAVSVAVIAIAAVGFLMLTGRVSYRRGFGAVIGCFILFAAAGVGAGFRKSLATGPASDSIVLPSSGPFPGPQVSSTPPALYDPNAGVTGQSR